MKKMTGKHAEDHYTITHPLTGQVINLEPEYNVMSRRPGIGNEWFEKYQKDCFPSDHLVRKGRPVKVPKYYDNLFAEREPEAFEVIKEQRKISAKTRRFDNTPDRLEVREKVKLLSIKSLKRKLDEK